MPQSLRSFAMTDLIDCTAAPTLSLRGGFFGNPTWQSFGNCVPNRHFPEIATVASLLRNDKLEDLQRSSYIVIARRRFQDRRRGNLLAAAFQIGTSLRGAVPYGFTTFTGAPLRNCFRLSTAVSMRRWRLSFAAQAIWGVIKQLGAVSRGLSAAGGS